MGPVLALDCKMHSQFGKHGEEPKMKILYALCLVCVAAGLVSQSNSQTPQASHRAIVRSITYENLKSVTVDDILRRFKEKGITLAVERAYDPQEVAAATKVLKDFLAEQGQPDAEIKTAAEPIPPSSIAITFTVVKK
jgi:outer membrane protein assembly factor BamA